MIAKQQKLNLRQELDFFSTAQKKHFKDFSFYFQDVSELKKNLFVVIVPKKYIKSASKRNKLKRQGYDFLTSLKLAQKYKIALVLKKEEIDFKKISQKIIELF